MQKKAEMQKKTYGVHIAIFSKKIQKKLQEFTKIVTKIL